MRAVVDTGPLVAAANRRDRAHGLAAQVVYGIGGDLVIPSPVLVETDYLLRTKVGVSTARSFLASVAGGRFRVSFLTPRLLSRAAELDARYADLDLGLVDASVMAIAERHRLPILTFDFEDFRATRPARGHWRLVVDEAAYDEATS